MGGTTSEAIRRRLTSPHTGFPFIVHVALQLMCRRNKRVEELAEQLSANVWCRSGFLVLEESLKSHSLTHQTMLTNRGRPKAVSRSSYLPVTSHSGTEPTGGTSIDSHVSPQANRTYLGTHELSAIHGQALKQGAPFEMGSICLG